MFVIGFLFFFLQKGKKWDSGKKIIILTIKLFVERIIQEFECGNQNIYIIII